MARRMVVVSGPGVAGVDGGELGCGRRSSGETRATTRGHERASCGRQRARGDVLSTMVHSGGSSSGSGHDGDEARRRRALGSGGEAARVRGRARGGGGNGVELTGVATVASGSSGRHRSR